MQQIKSKNMLFGLRYGFYLLSVVSAAEKRSIFDIFETENSYICVIKCLHKSVSEIYCQYISNTNYIIEDYGRRSLYLKHGRRLRNLIKI